MPNSFRCLSRSETCRIEWRPSRWLLAALALIAILAVFSILASEMPRPAAWPLSVLAAGYGAWTIHRETRKPPRELVFPNDHAAPVRVDGQEVGKVVVHWRGPLAFVQWKDAKGRAGRLSFWPDTLPAARRRELRLAAGGGDVSQNRPAMAP